MFKKLLVLTVLFGFCVCNARGEQIPCSWIGGTEGLWGDPCNWDCAAIPDNDGDTFLVTIDNTGLGVDGIDVGLTQSRAIDGLVCNG